MSGAQSISSGAALNTAQTATKAQQGPLSPATTTAQSAEAGAQTAAAADSANKGQGTDFPALFKSMMEITPSDAGQTDAQIAAQLDPALVGKAKNKTQDTDANTDAADAAAIAGLPGVAAEAGKGLPQLAWSGYVGVANHGDAAALALQGDQSGVISSQTVAGKDLPSAILKAQEQVANAQLQHAATPLADGSDFSTLMGKESLPALHLQQKFMADTLATPSTQTLNPASLNGVQHAGLSDLSALTALSANRVIDNPTQAVTVAVQNPQWSQQVGDRVQWMIGQNLHQADIHLHPPELGALKVHIQMNGDQASVNFSSPHAQVRDALDAAMPRLREMMHNAGLTLGDVNVSGQALAQHQPRDSGQQQGHTGQYRPAGHADEPQPVVATSAIRQLSPNSKLDVYA